MGLFILDLGILVEIVQSRLVAKGIFFILGQMVGRKGLIIFALAGAVLNPPLILMMDEGDVSWIPKLSLPSPSSASDSIIAHASSSSSSETEEFSTPTSSLEELPNVEAPGIKDRMYSHTFVPGSEEHQRFLYDQLLPVIKSKLAIWRKEGKLIPHGKSDEELYDLLRPELIQSIGEGVDCGTEFTKLRWEDFVTAPWGARYGKLSKGLKPFCRSFDDD